MKRKSLFYTFYLTIPCIILTTIALSSFLIHVESGERVGFVTTVLLSFTVFLLMIPSFLPITSDGVPVLGVLLEGSMIVITLVLFANIFSVWVYFREGTPPTWVCKINRFFGRRQKAQKVSATRGVLAGAGLQPTLQMCSIEITEPNEKRTPEHKEEGDETPSNIWQAVSTKLDRAFFVLFVAICAIAYAIYFSEAV